MLQEANKAGHLDFEVSGIEIVKRRNAAAVRSLLEGSQITAEGQEKIIAGTSGQNRDNLTHLCGLDLEGMKALGLAIADRRFLANLLDMVDPRR